MIAAPQAKLSCTRSCSAATWEAMAVEGEPSIRGVTKADMETAKTSMVPPKTPGIDSGRITLRRVRQGEAPRAVDASASEGGMRRSAP